MNQFLIKLQDPRLPQVVNVIIVIFFVYQLWQFIVIFLPKPVPTSDFTPVTRQTLPSLANLHLFGLYSSNIGSLPQAQLAGLLNGILYSTNPQQSRAFLSIPGMPPKSYKIGDIIPGTNAIIQQILPHSIIILQNGQLFNLPLPKQPLQFAPPPRGLTE